MTDDERQGVGMKPIKVLLVDDEEDFVTTVSDRIKAYRFKTDTALSGE